MSQWTMGRATTLRHLAVNVEIIEKKINIFFQSLEGKNTILVKQQH